MNEVLGKISEKTHQFADLKDTVAPNPKNFSNKAKQAIADMENDVDECKEIEGAKRIRIVSYNCENLYDTYDDPKTNDDEFTPKGEKNWTTQKYKIKLINVAKAIRAAGKGTMPEIVGLMEIENKTVLTHLREQDIMKDAGYRYVHKDSPDARGVDVALLYQKSKMKLLEEKWYPVKLANDGKTRDILYAKLELENKETLHVFVNHWPSMREGEQETEEKRVKAASTLRHVVDSINSAEHNKANIVIMGDFNSKLSQTSLSKTLRVKGNSTSDGTLCDMMSRYEGNDNIGTHKYGGKWDVLDHIIVDGGMCKNNRKVFTTPYSSHICHDLFLLTQAKSGFYSPKRSFKGNYWNSGYSDHLPISLDIYLK